MGKSARILGKEYGLNAQEMNFHLKEEGFLDGESGNYFFTEKGSKYGHEEYHHRGKGGYAHYNRSWITRTWDDRIADELNITDDTKTNIRQAISIERCKNKEIENHYIDTDNQNEGYSCEFYNNPEEDEDNHEISEAICALLILGTAFAASKALPHIKRLWNIKATPKIQDIKQKFNHKDKLLKSK